MPREHIEILRRAADHVKRSSPDSMPFRLTWTDGSDVVVCLLQRAAVNPEQVRDANRRGTAQASCAVDVHSAGWQW